MPAITPTHAAGTQLSPLLQDVLNTEQKKWNNFFYPDKMKPFFKDLTAYIQTHNIFTPDNPINSFLDLLKEFMQSRSVTIINNVDYDSNFLNHIANFFKESKTTILKQQSFTQEPIKITVNYLQLICSFFLEKNKGLFEKLTFTVNDLNEITIHIVKNRAPDTYIRNLVASYIFIMKSSLNIEKFLLNYQQEDFFSKNVVELSKLIFSQQDSQALFTIPLFFSALAYEIDFVARSCKKLNISFSEIGMRQEKILITVTNLQNFFLNHLVDKHKCPSDGLKYLFFKYFQQEAQEIQASLSQRYAAILKYYSDEQFTPLPFTAECSAVPPNKFIIKHFGLTAEELEVICQANQCAERNYGQWLKRAGFDFNQLPNGYLTYHVFNESRYDADLNYYEKFEPVSTAMYSFGKWNTTMVHGTIYAQHKSNKENQWQTAAHECTHHLNARLGYMPRSPDEGLGYRIPLGFCIDASFQRSVNNKYKTVNLTKSFFSSGFIGYDPSTLLASYFVDTNPSGFVEILRSSRDYTGSTSQNITKKIEQLISQDMEFAIWKIQMLAKCRHHIFHKLGEGNGYCPPLLDNTLSENLMNIKSSPIKVARTTTRLPKNIPLLSPRTWTHLTPDQKSYELIFTISRNEFLEFSELLNNGANPNFCDESTGNTPLHFLYFYRNCDVQYLELLLEYGATITRNHQGLLPLQMADTMCSATQFLEIKEIFENFTTQDATPITQVALPTPQEELPITISIPISALTSGVISGAWLELALRNKEQYPYLPNMILYGLKPASLAISNSAINIWLEGSAEAIGLDDMGLSFVYYLGVNYLGLVFAQIGEGLAQKVQNKIMSLFISILFYTFLINPSLLIELMNKGLTHKTFSNVMLPALATLLNGLFFKIGEYGTQKVINFCMPRNEQSANSRTYIAYGLGETDDSEDSRLNKHFMEFKRYFTDLKKLFDPILKKPHYKLIFNKNLNLLQEIANLESINDIDASPDDFTKAVTALNEIQENLAQLGKFSNKKAIISLITDKLIPTMSSVKPSQQIHNWSSNTKHRQGEHTSQDQPHYSTPLRRDNLNNISFSFNSHATYFPPPPSLEQLQEMTKEKPGIIYQSRSSFS